MEQLSDIFVLIIYLITTLAYDVETPHMYFPRWKDLKLLNINKGIRYTSPIIQSYDVFRQSYQNVVKVSMQSRVFMQNILLYKYRYYT